MTISKRYITWLLISILIAFHSLNNYFWLRQDCESSCCDVVHHTYITVELHQNLENIIFSNISLIDKIRLTLPLLNQGGLRWPRLVHFIAATISFVSWDILFWIRFSNLLYFIILFVSVYLLGKKIYGQGAGIIAACLVSFYPAIFGLSRKFGLDFPLIGMVCLTLYFLFSCDGFKNIFYTMLFGISLGLGILIKGQEMLFIIGPFLYVVYNGFKERQHKIKYILSIATTMGLVLLISLIWWINFLSNEAKWDIYRTLSGGYGQIFTAQSGFHILNIYLNGVILVRNIIVEVLISQIKGIILNVSPVFFLFFLAGLVFYLRNLNKAKVFVLIWLFIPYFIFSIILLRGHDEEYRHVFPAYSAVALISAIGWLESPIKKNLKVIFVSLFILVGIFQFFSVSYQRCYPFIDYRYAHPPEKNNHKLIMQEFNKIIRGYSLRGKNIAIIEEEYFFGDKSMRLRYLLKLFNKANNICSSAYGAISPRLRHEFLSNVNAYDFLIVFSESSLSPDFSGLLKFCDDDKKESMVEIIKKFERFKILEKKTILPEKINIFLLRKIAS